MDQLSSLRRRIIACRTCPRLAEYRERVAREKRRAFLDWTYWGRPVPGFGDPRAQLVIIGLAPAAHGGNRTGRVFTGDPSAAFLMRGLFEAGIANQPSSETKDDGLRLFDAYITAAVRCAPPGNKPSAVEIHRCAPYLHEEMDILEPMAILTLGRLAFDAAKRYMTERHGVPPTDIDFRHGVVYEYGPEVPALFVSYHPSPRNTQTGLMSRESFQGVLDRVARWLREGPKRQ